MNEQRMLRFSVGFIYVTRKVIQYAMCQCEKIITLHRSVNSIKELSWASSVNILLYNQYNILLYSYYTIHKSYNPHHRKNLATHILEPSPTLLKINFLTSIKKTIDTYLLKKCLK